MRRQHVNIVTPAHQGQSPILQTKVTGHMRSLDPGAVAPPRFEAGDGVCEQNGQATVMGVLAGTGSFKP